MTDNLLGRVLHLLVFLGICAGIIWIGWKDPLRFRFMSEREIAELSTPAPTPRPKPTMWHPSGNTLDRAPYTRKENKVEFQIERIDRQRMGTTSETEQRTGLRSR